MLILAATFALALASATPSASTLAAVKIFAVNVDRQWPTDDERAAAVTGEALRLMAVAARGMADDWKVDDGKWRDAIASFDSAREILSRHPRGDKERPESARDALNQGREMIDRLAAALNCTEATARDRDQLEQLAKKFDKRRPVAEQVADLQKYFQQAAKLMESMLDAAPSP